MRIEFIVSMPCQRPQREQVEAGRNRLPLPQGLLDFGFELSWQSRGMLTEEFEDVIPNELVVAAIRNAEHVGDAKGVKVYGERVVGYDEIF